MRGRECVLTVPEGDAPYFARLAAAIVAEIRRGRLKPGDALPGSRTLAALLGKHADAPSLSFTLPDVCRGNRFN